MKKQIIIMSGLIISLFIFGQCSNNTMKNKIKTLEKNSNPFQNLSMQEAKQNALLAAKEVAIPLIDLKFHDNGKTIIVPNDYATIQSAIDIATKGDIVLVKPGTYYELIVMKDGVKLISDSSNGGDKLVSLDGVWLKLPKRTLQTIIDGSKSETSKHGMIDFNPGIGRNSIIDGFTIQNLPKQNHHIPGHAHGLNVRGASPVIMNCLIQKMGSTGIGMHVIFKDQGQAIATRDFREVNIQHQASPVIYNNIVQDNYGLGIGSNHFSKAYILGNEVINNNDSEINGTPSPAMGNKHGSAATIVGNIVHDNPGGGILVGKGEPQGKYLIDKPTHPKIIKNVVYKNGSIRPALSCSQAGSIETPVSFIANHIYNIETVGISVANESFAIIEDNVVSGNSGSGIIVMSSRAIKYDGNSVSENLRKMASSNTGSSKNFGTKQKTMLRKLTIKQKQFHDDKEMKYFFKQKIKCVQNATNNSDLEDCKNIQSPRQNHQKTQIIQSQVDWQTDLSKAKEIASVKKQKIILVFSGSDWCTPCIKLEKEIWNSTAFITYAKDNFIMLKADFPKKKKNKLSKEQQKSNNLLAEQYNPNGFFPLVVILNSGGAVLGTTGYQKVSAQEYIDLLNSFE